MIVKPDSIGDSAEEWRDIPGHEGAYQASSLGRVRSLDRLIPPGKGVTRRLARGRVLRSVRQRYLQVSLCADGVERKAYVHSLIAAAFIGPRPNGMEVAHNDGNSLNNAASNLRYATPKDNHADKRLHGTQPVGARHHSAKLTDTDVAVVRALHSSGRRVRDIADEYGITPRYVRRIVAFECRAAIQA